MWARIAISCLFIVLAVFAGCGVPVFSERHMSPSAPVRAAEGAAPVTPEDEAKFRAAKDLIMELRYAEAERLLEDLVKKFERAGRFDYASKSLFWFGYCAEKLSRMPDALFRYDGVIEKYPDTRAAEQARIRKTQMGIVEEKKE
jgi:TolA-binding protein